METATVEANARTIDSGVSASKQVGWRREVVTAVAVVGLLLAGVEGVAFAIWSVDDSAAWLPAAVLLAIVVVASVVALGVSLAGGPVDNAREWSDGWQWTCLAAIAFGAVASMGNAVFAPVIIAAESAEHPDAWPSTLASVKGQRYLLLNWFSIGIFLLLAVGFVGLLVRRRHRSA